MDLLLFFLIHVLTTAVIIGGLEVTNAAALLGVYALLLLLYGAPEMAGSGTIGKRLLRLHVRDRTGAEASRGRLALRWILKAAPILGCFGIAFTLAFTDWGLGDGVDLAFLGTVMLNGLFFLLGAADFLFILRPGRLALRDHVAGTAVMKRGGE